MKRLYYITAKIETAENISQALHHAGISDWHFHVLSRDKAGLANHHIHSATPLQERDLIHSSQRGGIIGGILGVCLGALLMATGIISTSPLGIVGFAALVVVFLMHGMWSGGLLGLQRENYKIRKFHHELEAGQYLLMIDVAAKDEKAIRGLVAQYGDALPRGNDSTITTPFGGGSRSLSH